MNRSRRLACGRMLKGAFKGASSLVLLLSGHQLALGAGIVAVRVWPALDYTRVTIESDMLLKAQHSLVTDGTPRLVVDIDGLQLDAGLRELLGKIKADDPYIAGVRVGQFAPRVVRIVFDLKQVVLPQRFNLDPVARYQHRLVLDLYPQNPPDPLLQLLKDKDAAERQAAQSVQESLDALITKVDRPAAVPPAAAPPAGPALPGLSAGGAAPTKPAALPSAGTASPVMPPVASPSTAPPTPATPPTTATAQRLPNSPNTATGNAAGRSNQGSRAGKAAAPLTSSHGAKRTGTAGSSNRGGSSSRGGRSGSSRASRPTGSTRRNRRAIAGRTRSRRHGRKVPTMTGNRPRSAPRTSSFRRSSGSSAARNARGPNK